MVEKDLRVERRDDGVMNKMDNRNHGEDCVKLENDLRVKMRDADGKEVDIGAVSTKTDQHPPGESYLYQFSERKVKVNLKVSHSD